MSTNYYFIEGHVHIGKRSAAGLYCYVCNVTLCKTGEDDIHAFGEWYEVCPKCGAKLGDGVGNCSSFSWAIDQNEFAERSGLSNNITGFKTSGQNIIKNEYGVIYTRERFIELLNDCPIKFYGSIGTKFS